MHNIIEDEKLNPWKAILIDALVISWIYKKEHDHSPQKALSDLISWEIELALDPRISASAVELQRKAVEEYINEQNKSKKEKEC